MQGTESTQSVADPRYEPRQSDFKVYALKHYAILSL